MHRSYLNIDTSNIMFRLQAQKKSGYRVTDRNSSQSGKSVREPLNYKREMTIELYMGFKDRYFSLVN